jgi:asparagine synthase (glutamine-hydrolysing)
MANFLVIVDADAPRRDRFIRTIEPLLPPIEGLETVRCAHGDFCAIWAGHPQAPISQSADETGAAVLWGDAIPKSVMQPVNAQQMRDHWSVLPERLPAPYDGFHAGVVHRQDNGIVVGADILGLFPVYYCGWTDVLLVASSPELFHYHPCFRKELNAAGLVGILLTMHLIDGQTLWRNVRRLAPGHLLTWRPGALPQEKLQYRIPFSTRYHDLPLEAQVRLIDNALDEAVTRHAPASQSHSLLLSGGLDSRMLGGFLKRQGRSNTVAVTFGLPSDVDFRCASRVARTLGFSHHPVNVAGDCYPHYAECQARWEHLANGFNTIMNWGTPRALGAVKPRVVTGYLGNVILGGAHIEGAYSPSQGNFSFKTYFAHHNGWGIRSKVLKKLLRREVFGDLVDETIARLETAYLESADEESHRAWCAHLQHRQRFHVGSALWPLSFGAWPVQPCVDQKVLEVMSAMPVVTLEERRLQLDLVNRRFPHLAAIPLDRNVDYALPIRPRFRWLLAWHLYGRAWEALQQKAGQVDPRYYCRTYNFNSSAWMAVRHEAEPYRSRIQHLFNMDVFNELLPPPQATVEFHDGLADASGPKLLVGLLLWAKDHE